MVIGASYAYKESVTLILSVAPPIGRALIKRSVTSRVTAVRKNINLTIDEIYNPLYTTHIPDERINAVIAQLDAYVYLMQIRLCDRI